MTDNIELSHQQQRAFQPQKLSAPRDFMTPEVLMNRQLPLVLEIGAGKGKHALSFALQHPDKHLRAIERTRNKFDAFAKLVGQQKSSDLSAIHADAIAWIVHAVAPNSTERMFTL